MTTLATQLSELFHGRKDFMAVAAGKGFGPRKGGPTEADLRGHLNGGPCCGFYVLTSENQVFASCLDFDHKPKKGRSDPEWRTKVETIYFALSKAGVTPLVERSQSGRGAHVWLHFCEAVDAWVVRAFWRALLHKLNLATGTEIFPKQDYLKDDGLGNLVRFPLWAQSRFVDVEDNWSVMKAPEALKCVEKLTAADLRQLAAEMRLGELKESQRPVQSGHNGPAVPPTVEDRRLALEALAKLSPERADRYGGDREDPGWLEVGMCMHTVDSGSEMLEAWDKWSRQSDKWSAGVCAEKWDGFRGDGGWGIGSLITWAREDSGDPAAEQPGNERAAQATVTDRLTDVGNGRRFAARYKDSALYCPALKKWFVWSGTHWKADDLLQVQTLAKDLIAEWFESAIKNKDSKRRDALLTHASKSEQWPRVKAMLETAQSELAVPVEKFDQDPWLFNTASGTIDLKTGKLREHRVGDFISKISPVTYDSELSPDNPEWMGFLATIFERNAPVMEFIRRWAGYGLTGITTEQVFCYFFGPGGMNGKSTLLTALLDVMGDYGAQADPNLLTASAASDGPTPGLVRLIGKRFVPSIEVDNGRSLAESLVKAMTGGDRIVARGLYAHPVEFTATFKITIAANHKLNIKSTDGGIWRRVLMVPFRYQIPEAERDPDFGEKLKAIYPYILRWCVQGCVDWREDGLNPPEKVLGATREYRSESDKTREFVNEWCIVSPSQRISVKDLYHAYRLHCVENQDNSLGKQRFNRALEDSGLVKEPGNDNVLTWLGIGLTSQGIETLEADRRRESP